MYIQFRDYIEEVEDITSDKDFVLRKKWQSIYWFIYPAQTVTERLHQAK